MPTPQNYIQFPLNSVIDSSKNMNNFREITDLELVRLPLLILQRLRSIQFLQTDRSHPMDLAERSPLRLLQAIRRAAGAGQPEPCGTTSLKTGCKIINYTLKN
jgi:hypothetical protein